MVIVTLMKKDRRSRRKKPKNDERTGARGLLGRAGGRKERRGKEDRIGWMTRFGRDEALRVTRGTKMRKRERSPSDEKEDARR